MRNSWLFTIFCLISIPAWANSDLPKVGVQCVWKHAVPIAKQLRQMKLTDKAMHCAMSCQLTNKCDRYQALGIMTLKELIDLLGFGHPEWADMRANVIGIRLAYSGQAQNFQQCLDNCLVFYPQ